MADRKEDDSTSVYTLRVEKADWAIFVELRDALQARRPGGKVTSRYVFKHLVAAGKREIEKEDAMA